MKFKSLLSIIASSLVLFSLANSTYSQEFRVTSFPSTSTNSANTENLDKKIQEQLKTSQENDVLNVYLQKDALWHKAQQILKQMANGDINSNNLSQYLSPEMQKINDTHKDPFAPLLKMIQQFKNTIQAKHLTDPSNRNNNGLIIIEKSPSDLIAVVSVFYLSKLNTNKPTSNITIALTASKPYKTWKIGGLWLNLTRKKEKNDNGDEKRYMNNMMEIMKKEVKNVE